MKNTKRVFQLTEGESYYLLRKDEGFVYLGKLLRNESNILSNCWHDGPTIEYILEFENMNYGPYKYYSSTAGGFITASDAEKYKTSLPKLKPL